MFRFEFYNPIKYFVIVATCESILIRLLVKFNSMNLHKKNEYLSFLQIAGQNHRSGQAVRRFSPVYWTANTPFNIDWKGTLIYNIQTRTHSRGFTKLLSAY